MCREFSRSFLSVADDRSGFLSQPEPVRLTPQPRQLAQAYTTLNCISMASPAFRHDSINSQTVPDHPCSPSPATDSAAPPLLSDPSPPPSTSKAVGASLLRDYAFHIDPSQTANEVGRRATPQQSLKPAASAASPHPMQARENQTTSTSPPTSSTPFLPFRAAPSIGRHSRNAISCDLIPRQTLMKALASRPCSNNHNSNMPLAAPFSLQNSATSPPEDTERRPHTSASSQKLSAALSNLQLSSYAERAPSTARLIMQSPCFFHKRFDDAVNLQKVLEEVTDDEWLSHSRLLQTATGVREVSKQLQRRPIKRAVKNVMIVTKARDNSLVHLTRDLTEWLLSTPRYGSDLGVNVYVDAKLRHSKRFDAQGLIQKNPAFEHMIHYWTPDLCWTSPEKFDLVLTLGGDGTVLFTSWLFQRIVPPVLCFSLGSLGFLTNFEFENYKSHLNAVMGDVGMRVNLRMRFTCTVFRKDRSKGAEAGAVEEGEQFEVLNELVIDRGPSPYVSNLELYADNDLLTVVQADGCIFSTPTGMYSHNYDIDRRSELTRCRIHRLLTVRWRLSHSSRYSWNSPYTYLPSHSIFPTHGSLRFATSPHCCAGWVPVDGILLI